MAVDSEAPDPGRARTLDEYIAALRLLRVRAGSPSVTDLTKRVHRLWAAAGRPPAERPARTTVWDCFRLGRRRPNQDLLIAVVTVLVDGDPALVERWRRALLNVLEDAETETYVAVTDRLPAETVAFTGRADLVAQLVSEMRVASEMRTARQTPGASTWVLDGMAGVGKTTLATRVGHLLVNAGCASAGVIFVDLRGYDSDHPPADPGAVLKSLLRLRGFSDDRIPRTLDQRAARYRELLAGTDTLVVLDNAADANQVSPLLPGSPGCVTLVTSRRRLVELPHARHVTMGPFTPAEACDLLRDAAGDRRVDAHPDKVAEIARSLGNLPLALSIVTDHLRDHPEWTLVDYPPTLARLALEGGLRRTLALSDRALPDGASALLRLLALHPGTDFDLPAAAALADQTQPDTQRALDALVTANLLRRENARYRCDDLVRAYAGDRVTLDESYTRIEQARTRVLDHYRAGVAAAVGRLHSDLRELGRRGEPPDPDPLAHAAMNGSTESQARSWLDSELANLIAAARVSARRSPAVTWELSTMLGRRLDEQARYREAQTLHTSALHAARLAGDPDAEATALRQLGEICMRMGRYTEALSQEHRAVKLFRISGNQIGEARTWGSLGLLHLELGRHETALSQFQRGLVLARATGQRAQETFALAGVGRALAAMGRYDSARDQQHRALDHFHALGDSGGVSYVLHSLGDTDRQQGRHQRALTHYERLLVISRETGLRMGEVSALNGMGDVMNDTGDAAAALDCHNQVLALADVTRHFERIRALKGAARAYRALGQPQARDHLARILRAATTSAPPA